MLSTPFVPSAEILTTSPWMVALFRVVLPATPLDFPLVTLMFPPLTLERYGAAVDVGSADETWIVESTVTVPLEELRLTVPPAPPKPIAGAFCPVVAVMSAP